MCRLPPRFTRTDTLFPSTTRFQAPGGQQRARLREWGALSGGQLAEDILRSWADGEHWLRLLTALFLHADWAHLLGNLVFLLIFGLPAERVMGPWRFLLLFLVGGCLAKIPAPPLPAARSEEHTSELQSLMSHSY